LTPRLTTRLRQVQEDIRQLPDKKTTEDDADDDDTKTTIMMMTMTMTMGTRTWTMTTTQPDHMDEDHAETLFEFAGWEALPSAHEHASNLSIQRHDDGRRRRELTYNPLILCKPVGWE
jgi:hypothetical protein